MTIPLQQSLNCDVCGCGDTRAAFEYAGYHLAKCTNCSHVFVAERIPATVLERAYEEDFYVDDSGGTIQKGYADYLQTLDKRLTGFTRWFRSLERTIGTSGRCIDFGCAIGVLVKAAQDCGWDAYGYERSQWAAAYGRKRFGVTIETGDGQLDPFEPASFDLVTLWDVLEHVQDPRHVIALAAKWLRPGGWLVVNTVNSGSAGAKLSGTSWRHLNPPLHLQYFTRRSLGVLLGANGFQIKRMKSNGVFLSASRGAVTRKGLQRVIEVLATHWRARPVVGALNLLDEVEVFAQRCGTVLHQPRAGVSTVPPRHE